MLESDLNARRQLVARHLLAENAHRLDETLATLHPDCVFEDVALARVYRGRDGAAEYYRTWWSAFAVEVQAADNYWTADGRLIAEARYAGTNAGEFYGLAPTGRPIVLRLAVFIDFKDGLMAGERFYYDLSSLLSQLGAARLPALG